MTPTTSIFICLLITSVHFSRYAIDIAIQFSVGPVNTGFSTNDVQTFTKLLHDLSFLSNIDEEITKSCDCSFLYFRKDIISLLVKQQWTNHNEGGSTQLQLLASAFSDPARSLLRSSPYVDNTTGRKMDPLYLKLYRNFLIYTLNVEIILPVCSAIENDLRLQIFAKNLKEMEPRNPKLAKLTSHSRLLEVPPLYICGSFLNIKQHVKRYLEKTFYNFSTVGLQDSKTYAEMSLLAHHMYDIELVDSHLPPCGPEQGMDLMHITRDIDGMFLLSF